MNIKYSLLLLLFYTSNIYAQHTSSVPSKIAFYNLENFFDTTSNYGYDDMEFTPQGSAAWNKDKYNTKLRNTSRIISDLRPDILGVCEAENGTVINELLAQKDIKDLKYKYIHLDTKDSRGLDPAFIYRDQFFRVIEYRQVESPKNSRGVLYVKGIVKSSEDTLHVMVNHWTSRYMGQKATEGARIDMARLLCEISDSIIKRSPKAKIVIMGDLNDTPNDRSMEAFFSCGKGFANHSDQVKTPSYYYQKEWLCFDQIFTNFVDTKSLVKVFKPKYLLNAKGTPLRTYQGPVYLAGYSDHLLVYIEHKF